MTSSNASRRTWTLAGVALLLALPTGCSCDAPSSPDTGADASGGDASSGVDAPDPIDATRIDAADDDGGLTSELPTFGTIAWHADVAAGTDAMAGNVMPTTAVLDSDGRAYVGFTFEGTATFAPDLAMRSPGSFDGAVARYESDGSLGWARHMSGLTRSPVTGLVVHGDSVLVAGQFDQICEEGPPDCEGYRNVTISAGEADAIELRAGGPVDAFLAELTLDGALIRAAQFGGPGAVTALALAEHDGTAYLGGAYTGPVAALPGDTRAADGTDGYVSSITIGESFETASLVTTFGGPDVDPDSDPDAPDAIDVSESGGIALGGRIGSRTSFGSEASVDAEPGSAFIASYDAAHAVRWVATIGGTGFAAVWEVALDSDDGVWFTGTYSGSVRAYDRSDAITELPPTTRMNTFFGHFDDAGILTELLVTVDSIESHLALLPSGEPVLLQTIASSTSLPSSDGMTLPITVASESRVTVARYRTDATLQGVIVLEATGGGIGFARGHTLATGANGSILIGGRFEGELTLGVGRSDARTVEGHEGFDAFIARIDP